MAELHLDATATAADNPPLSTEDAFAQRWRERFARFKWLLFSFEGRLGPGAFFVSGFLVWAVGFGVLFTVTSFLQTGLTTVSNPLAAASSSDDPFTVGFIVAAPLFFWMNFALAFKRLHDFGASKGTFFALIAVSFIPYIGPMVVFGWQIKPGDSGPNQYGDGPGWAFRNVSPETGDTAPAVERTSVLRLT